MGFNLDFHFVKHLQEFSFQHLQHGKSIFYVGDEEHLKMI